MPVTNKNNEMTAGTTSWTHKRVGMYHDQPLETCRSTCILGTYFSQTVYVFSTRNVVSILRTINVFFAASLSLEHLLFAN